MTTYSVKDHGHRVKQHLQLKRAIDSVFGGHIKLTASSSIRTIIKRRS